MSETILIKKTNGEVVPFDAEKVIKSIERTGTNTETAKDILKFVETKLTPKITTAKIYAIVNAELQKRKPWAAARYNLRQAITKLGPAGFHFEKYVASILEAYGYKTETPDTYQGACVMHEIDVTAEKEGRTSFIEAKFRRDFSGTVNIKDTLATWARFLDLVDGSKVDLCPHFDEAWIVTNARFTDQSLKFGHCKNMMLIGWNHPKERTFAQMVDLNALYPVTILSELKKSELDSFSSADLMLCRDLAGMNADSLRNVTGLPVKRLDLILKECEAILNGE